MNDIKSLARSFAYALHGIKWALCHERNFRIHIICMCYMFYYLLRYDFFVISKTEICVLILSCALVLGGELINTGIEKADDTVSKERKKTIAISKDAAAGAVLVFAAFSVVIGLPTCHFQRLSPSVSIEMRKFFIRYLVVYLTEIRFFTYFSIFCK